MKRLPVLLAAVLLAGPLARAQTVVLLPFRNLSGSAEAPALVATALVRKIEKQGYQVIRGEAVDEFLGAERVRYLDSLPTPVRVRLLARFSAKAAILGTIFSFAESDNPVVAIAARMVEADGRVAWSAVAGLSADDTTKVFGLGRVASLPFLSDEAVSVMAEDFPAPGKSVTLASARAKPIDIPSPRTYRSATLGKTPVLLCLLPLVNESRDRLAGPIVGELLGQRLAASRDFRVVEAGDFRTAMVSTGVYGMRTGDPEELKKLGAKVGTNLFLKGTIYGYRDVLPGSGVRSPELEMQLTLVNVATGKILWTASVARKGTDYSGLFELGAISNAVTLADQAAAEVVAAFDHTEGKGRHALTATVVVSDKIYDRTATATIASCKVSGAPAADAANLQCAAASASFSDANAGTGKTVTVTGLTLSGSAASRYVLDSDTATTTATIRPKPVPVSIAAADKTYDGTPSATISSCALSGLLAADTEAVSCAAAGGSFADANAGSGKTVTAGGITISGPASSNYAPSSTTVTSTATIRRKPLTPEVKVSNKTYDGTVGATIASCGFPGVIPADAAGVNCRVGAADFGDANAGTEKLVKVTGIGLSGPASANYLLVESALEATAEIAPKPFEASIAAADKVYDGTPAAPVAGCTLRGVIPADSGRVGCDASSAAFPDKNAGAAKPVTASVALTGAAAGNYVLASSNATATASIAPKPLTPSGVIAREKTYDGTTEARLDLGGATLPDAVEGDDVALDGSRAAAAFADKDAGTSKAVAVSGLALGGRDAANYALTQPAPHAAILPRAVEARIEAAGKVYDGTTAAELTGTTLTGVLPAEADGVRLAVGAAAFDAKNAGTARTVVATGLSLTGDASRNYVLASPSAKARASITPKHVTGSFTVGDKRYDGNPWVAVRTRSLVGTIPGDAVKLSGGRARFADASVGSGKTVTLEGAKVTGSDSGNYALDNVAPTTADISTSQREHQ